MCKWERVNVDEVKKCLVCGLVPLSSDTSEDGGEEGGDWRDSAELGQWTVGGGKGPKGKGGRGGGRHSKRNF